MGKGSSVTDISISYVVFSSKKEIKTLTCSVAKNPVWGSEWASWCFGTLCWQCVFYQHTVRKLTGWVSLTSLDFLKLWLLDLVSRWSISICLLPERLSSWYPTGISTTRISLFLGQPSESSTIRLTSECLWGGTGSWIPIKLADRMDREGLSL